MSATEGVTITKTGEQGAFANHHPEHAGAVRTERHPDPDLTRAPRDGVGFHAINADDC